MGMLLVISIILIGGWLFFIGHYLIGLGLVAACNFIPTEIPG